MTDDLRRMDVDPATSQVFRSLADIVYASDDFTEVYGAIVSAAPRLVDGCDHASLMLQWDGTYITAGASDEVGHAVDVLERELGEGPCLDAIKDDSVYLDADLTRHSAWPLLSKRVLAETPVRGMAGFRLRAADQRSGALNLFCDTAGGMTLRTLDQGIVLASFITVALVAFSERRSADTLRHGLVSNREIGKAVGLLMAYHKISDEEAFGMLRRSSQDMNLKLADVARRVVEHHNGA